jgi:hypothetical protein
MEKLGKKLEKTLAMGPFAPLTLLRSPLVQAQTKNFA